MDLLEYQAKELFQHMGIPVLPSQRIEHPKDLKGLKIPYPVVLKSQVYTGGRGKAGGIKFAENTIDAVAAAQTIFNLPIMGQLPEVLLAEAKYDSDQELYLAVVLDRSLGRPLLLGSQQGGIEIESVSRHVEQVLVDQEFSPFYARRLAIKMGLRGELIQAVTTVIEKMYALFVQKDLDLVEINPLAVSQTGELMALDGKLVANDAALDRHPDLIALRRRVPGSVRRRTTMPLAPGMSLVELEGNIGILCNGAGLAMATLDLVAQASGRPANFLNVGGECAYNAPPDGLQKRVQQGLEILAQDAAIKVILVNLLGGVVPCKDIAVAIGSFLRRNNSGRPVPLVVRLMGRQFDEAQRHLKELEVPVFADLDEAIAQVVALSQPSKASRKEPG